MPSYYIEFTIFARSMFVKVAKWESNWAQVEEEVYNEQSEVIQIFPVFSDNLVSVDSFMEICLHLFFQVNNPKPLKMKSCWNRENLRLTSQDGLKKNQKCLTAVISYPSQPTMIVEWIVLLWFQQLSPPLWGAVNSALPLLNLCESIFFIISSEVWLWPCSLLVLGAS